MRHSRGILLLLVLGVPFLPRTILAVRAQSSRIDPAVYAGLRWRMIGPFRGGRVNAVTGVPGQPNTFYFGSVGGGVWKTTNSGRTWLPIFDSQPVASIGAIAVAASNAERRLRRHRRVRHAFADFVRQRHVQVASTPARPGRTSASTTRGRSRASPSIRRTRTSCSSPRSATPTAATRIAACSARATAARRGRRFCSRSNDVGAVDVTFDPAELADGLRRALEHPSSAVEHLSRRRTVRAAASTSRPTAARPGSR